MAAFIKYANGEGEGSFGSHRSHSYFNTLLNQIGAATSNLET